MSVRAHVIATGPYSKRIAEALWYQPDLYSHVPKGATILTLVFESVSSTTTHALTQAFGIGLWDFADHELDPRAANIELLQEAFGWHWPENFMVLRDAGFRFYFLPLH